MPSPFPGMDPYLEARNRWPDLHQRLIYLTTEVLQPQLRPSYIARIGERIQIASLPHHSIPDVMIVRTPDEEKSPQNAVLVADDPVTVELFDEAYHVPFVEIVSVGNGEVITVIEVLSPVNKYGQGRVEYIKKQKELLKTAVHLVEIDLLGYGGNTVAARHVSKVTPEDWRYIISISRAERRRRLEYYAIPINQRLPRCRIPLRSPAPDVVLDLPTVFNRAYDVGGYDLLIDYTQPVPVSLNEAEQKIVNSILKNRAS